KFGNGKAQRIRKPAAVLLTRGFKHTFAYLSFIRTSLYSVIWNPFRVPNSKPKYKSDANSMLSNLDKQDTKKGFPNFAKTSSEWISNVQLQVISDRRTEHSNQKTTFQ
ncbi:hypothetical protein STEG23_020523, partial [Scotinomys teguina]